MVGPLSRGVREEKWTVCVRFTLKDTHSDPFSTHLDLHLINTKYPTQSGGPPTQSGPVSTIPSSNGSRIWPRGRGAQLWSAQKNTQKCVIWASECNLGPQKWGVRRGRAPGAPLPGSATAFSLNQLRQKRDYEF